MAKCVVCGSEIVFRQNSRKRWIPFTKATGKNHYEECALKPKKEPEPSPQKELGEFENEIKRE